MHTGTINQGSALSRTGSLGPMVTPDGSYDLSWRALPSGNVGIIATTADGAEQVFDYPFTDGLQAWFLVSRAMAGEDIAEYFEEDEEEED
jgi:hypothetical protein